MSNTDIQDRGRWIQLEESMETLLLDSKHFEEAENISRNNQIVSRQWSNYLQALAFVSFEAWLQEREPSLTVTRAGCSVFQPEVASVIDAVCHLLVGEFRVCLIPTLQLTADEVAIPRAVVDIAEYAAHFYVVVALDEEAEVATIRGFLRYDQLIHYRNELQPDFDWNYPLPSTWLNTDANELLLNLQCLDPAAIALPAPADNDLAALARGQAGLVNLLPQIVERPLWEVLTWEQAVDVLTQPYLLHWLYQYQTEPAPARHQELITALGDLLKILTRKAMNVRLWMEKRLDDLATEVSWQMVPEAALVRETRRFDDRSIVQTLGELLEESLELEERPPENAGRVYQDIALTDGTYLRLYAVVWPIDEQNWTLVIIVGARPGDLPPYGLQLRVSDQTGVLVEESLVEAQNLAYLFAQVEGTHDDVFLVTLTSASGAIHELDPFAFPGGF